MQRHATHRVRDIRHDLLFDRHAMGFQRFLQRRVALDPGLARIIAAFHPACPARLMGDFPAFGIGTADDQMDRNLAQRVEIDRLAKHFLHLATGHKP